jgi:uncharacterized protein YqhQ
MMSTNPENTKQVGGQAVIEGVMMRAPRGVAISVRKRDGSIKTKSFPYVPRSERRKVLGLPIVKGAVALVEMLALGIDALNWSAQEATDDLEKEENREKKSSRSGSNAAIATTLVFALLLGFLFFFYLPLLLTGMLVGHENQVLFNIVDGFIRVIFFLVYIYAIQFIPDIKRIFQYHGAEHKAVFCYESGCDLSMEEAVVYSTKHPRCGTSFLLIVFVLAIIVFAIADSLLFGLTGLSPSRVVRLFFHLLLLPFVAGASYELMKFASKRTENKFVHLLLSPGLALQKITTVEPDRSQLEVGIVSLKEALSFEKGSGDGS